MAALQNRGENHMPKHAEPFNCPTCNGRYKLVRADADDQSSSGQIECYYCGGPLIGREGQLVLKYFVVDKSPKRARPSLVK
jgi:transcription elongation factor Elf1